MVICLWEFERFLRKSAFGKHEKAERKHLFCTEYIFLSHGSTVTATGSIFIFFLVFCKQIHICLKYRIIKVSL